MTIDLTAHGFNVVRVFHDADGESHLEDVEYSLATTNHGLIGENVAVEEVTLRAWTTQPDERFHVAPRRQFVIQLMGAAEVEVSDGSLRRLDVGTILLTEDTAIEGVESKGHCVRSLELPRLALFVPLLAKRKVKAGLLW